MKTHLVTTQALSQAALQSVVSASLIVTLLFAGFIAAEPRISHGQSDTKTFRVRQTITDETSFSVAPSNVTMAGSISGITGGSATGSSKFVVKSNNSTGYYVEMAYYDNPGQYAMLGDKDSGEQLRDYGGDVSGEPSYNFTASTAAQFAYTVNSSTTGDTDPSFKNNGSACNAGSTQTFGKCWKKPATSAFRIVSRSTAATAGATSTIYFKVHVPSGAVPIPTAQTYTATATLSVFTQ
jgi:hypothetical protein